MSGAVVASSVAGMLGTITGGSDLWASIIMILLAFLGGFVRQSGPHGPGITIGVLLIYLLCLDHPGHFVAAGEMFVWILSGGIIALVFTLFSWVFIPYSPFRHSVANIWKGMSDWLNAFSTIIKEGKPVTEDELDEKELDFRTALNASRDILSRKQAIAHARQNKLSYQLVELRRIISVAGPAVTSCRDAIDHLQKQKNFPGKLIAYILDNLTQAAHRMAVSIISNHRENVYTAKLSIKKAKNNIELLLNDLPESGNALFEQQLIQSLEDLIGYLEDAIELLEQMYKGSGRMTFFMRNFVTGMTIPQKIPMVRIELSWQSFVFRFSMRLALAMGIGVAIYKFFNIPHGYWIAMTAMIILQPEFGATLTKAFRRIKGTVLGAIVGSLIFIFPLPLPVSLSIVVLSSFIMAYYIQHNYAVAAFFITVMVIALYHLLEPVTWQLGLVRVLNTVGGAGLALLGGYAFFPLWERYRFPTLIKKAIEANKNYFEELLSISNINTKSNIDYIKPGREAEISNSNAFQSLKRMKEEPVHKQANQELFYVLTGYNIRLMRLLKTLNREILKTPDFSVIRLQDFKNEIIKILERAAVIAGTNSASPLSELPPPGSLIRHLDEIINSITYAPTSHHQTIKHLYERIIRETIGLYYTASQAKMPEEETKRAA